MSGRRRSRGIRPARWRSAVLRVRLPSWKSGQATTWLAVMCVLVPLLAEGAARLIYVLQYDDIDFLRYPSGVPVAPDAIAVRLEARNRNSPGPMAPGEHPYMVEQEIQYTLPINDSGFRGRDIESPREADVRIVSLGGSSTFSGECPMGASYPEVWGELLRSSSARERWRCSTWAWSATPPCRSAP